MRRIFIILFLLISTSVLSQDEMTVGVRGGLSWGPTFSISDGYKGFEGLVSFRKRGIQATAIYQIQKPLENKHRLNLWIYYGVGAHVGITKWKNWRYFDYGNGIEEWEYNNETGPVVGIDGKLGIEYRFYSVPVIIGMDYKPYIELFGRNFFNIQFFDFALTLKYAIN